MTSEDCSKIALDLLKKNTTNYDLVQVAQIYATLAVAAAQREYNEMKIGTILDERIPKG